MWDFIASTQFPETGEYLERLIPDTLDESITFAGSIEFKFRTHTDERGFVFPIPGLRTNKRTTYKIECKEELPFKSGDEIRFGKNDRRKYTITKIEFKVDKRNEEEYIFKSQSWPGFAEDSVKIKILYVE